MDPNTFKTTHSCLPVTALQALRLKQTSLILSGQGPFLSIIEPQSRILLACQRVFAWSTVHGIACESSREQKDASRHALKPSFDRDSVWFAKVLVWGGPSISIARFRISYEDHGTGISSIIVDDFEVGPTANVHDWILDGSFVNENASSEVQACLVTAHSNLFVLPFPHVQGSLLLDIDFLRHNPEIYGIPTGPKPFLYSACVQTFPAGIFSVLGGTAFGNICMWNTQHAENSSQLIELSTGHQGITFGVDRFDKWLATCSDDRGVRLGTFGAAAPLGEKWRHTSRVWGVKFIRTSTGALCLASVGEDSSCKVQQIAREGLIELVDDRYHSGKNIWSVADAYMRLHQVITGGADGAVVSRDVLQNAVTSHPKAAGSRFEHEQAALASLFAELDIHAVIKSGSNIKPPSVKQYVFTSHSRLLALTDSGYLFSIAKKHGASVDNCENHEGGRTTPAQETLMFSKWSVERKCINPFGKRPVLSDSEDHLVFVGDDSGNLFACFPAADDTVVRFVTRLDMPISWLAIAAVRHSSDLHRECCIVVYCDRKNLAKVVVAQLPMHIDETSIAKSSDNRLGESACRSGFFPEASSRPEVSALDLPEEFVPTSARVLNLTRVLVLGSRKSTLAIYRPILHITEPWRVPLTPIYQYSLRIRRVHGSDSVTSIRGIPPTEDVIDYNEEHFLTTGRNGTCVVHSVILENLGVTSEVQDIATSPLKFGIEGSYSSPTQEPQSGPGGSPRTPSWGDRYDIEGDGRVKHGDLILYGFDSEKFVVWNESRQSLIFSIECGNIHRAWAYNTYAFERPLNNGSFAWSQAGSLHLVTIDQTDHSTLQQGGHGREIKALSVSPLPFHDYRHAIRSGRLVATGAEDTTIRFFAVGPNVKADARNKLTLVRTVKKHNTGIQCLSFSSCGRYLFSSGGCEELYAWRIRHNVPGVNLGVVLDFTFPEDMPNSDLRITDFKIQDHHHLSGTFVVSAVYSNSMVKIFYFRPAESDPTQRCQLQKRFFYKQNCLTQIHHHLAAGILTAATDGYLVFWPVGAEEHNPKYPHRVHQNSVQAMRTVDLPFRKAGQHEQLVITGGDDNALSLTLIRMFADDPSRVNFRKPSFQCLQIPKAHAAAVTAVCVLSVSRSESWVTVRFLSASNDQRVRFWQARITLDKLGCEGAPFIGGSEDMDAVEVDLLASTGTSIADVGAMEQISESEGGLELVYFDDANAMRYPDGAKLASKSKGLARVMIVGVGMEVLEFPAENIGYN
jgi:WD repeat-containing protein 6